MSLSRLDMLNEAHHAATLKLAELGETLMHLEEGTPEHAKVRAAYTVAREQLRKARAYIIAEMGDDSVA